MSALASPHLENCEQFSGSQCERDMNLLVQKREKMIRGLELLSCEEQLKEVGLISLEKLLESSFAETDVGSCWIAS